jgi:type II secretory pathway pseudopilin PulG
MVTAARRAPRAARDHGYNLVVLTVAITVMTIAVATALPSWSGQIRRDKEEELVFRGLQMAEGIRVFQRRFGRPPATLDELFNAEPRVLRQAWKDPMTADGAWEVVTVQELAASRAGAPGQPGQPGQPARRGRRGGSQPEAAADQPPPVGPDGRPVQGPIAGVRTRARGTAMRTFFGSDRYAAWRFTHDLVEPGSLGPGQRSPDVFGINVGGRGGPSARMAIPNAAWIGRAFRDGLAPAGVPTARPAAPNPAAPGAPAPADDGDS